MEIELKYNGNTIEINRACLRKAGKLGEIVISFSIPFGSNTIEIQWK